MLEVCNEIPDCLEAKPFFTLLYSLSFITWSLWWSIAPRIYFDLLL